MALGRRHRGGDQAVGFGQAAALGTVVFLIPVYWAVLTPRRWDLGSSLPLQLCDLALFAAVIAFWTRARWACALVYYWGLTLTAQAFATPTLDGPDFPDFGFLAFWGTHLIVVWAAVYLTWGLGIVPGWREYRWTVAVTVGWAAVAFLVNLGLGTNYGFVNRKPPTASILDALGPWPWYLAVEFVLITSVWALITWPWVRRGSRRRAG